jgi:hypothetical protein
MTSGDEQKNPPTTYSRKQIIGVVLAVLAFLAVGEVAMKVHAVQERHRHPAMVQPPDMAKENPSQADQPDSTTPAPPQK